ncbi:PREDICTED: toll-like receptor 2 [Ceratosolen solmsi marchali]|uniref:Toll-like receptor 2 n=1 Tax=Ceratosolen solmsi marchali TaxID=326594 RepID=A0AAJ6VJH6_9HYME|nr:PREDICTED: toll-like receptor 2 [Ceratosolen solmsi marchali]
MRYKHIGTIGAILIGIFVLLAALMYYFNQVGKQQNLNWLILSNNKIQEISKGHLVGLTSLETLSADNNRIHTLNLQDLENSTTLELLDLGRNHLTSLNICLPYLPGLREL